MHMMIKHAVPCAIGAYGTACPEMVNTAYAVQITSRFTQNRAGTRVSYVAWLAATSKSNGFCSVYSAHYLPSPSFAGLPVRALAAARGAQRVASLHGRAVEDQDELAMCSVREEVDWGGAHESEGWSRAAGVAEYLRRWHGPGERMG